MSNLPAVPAEFVTILDITLQKLVAQNLLQKDFTGQTLFSKLRVKFSNASKKVTYIIIIDILFSFLYTIYPL